MIYLVAALIVLLVLAGVLIAWLLVYRARHRHTEADVLRAQARSVKQSHSTVSGKVQEHLAALFPEFITEFNPRDARFLGSPVDFVIFDGLDTDHVTRVVFVEIKTGKAGLTPRERLVRAAIDAGSVEFRTIKLPDMTSMKPEAAEDEIVGPVEDLGRWGFDGAGQVVKLDDDSG